MQLRLGGRSTLVSAAVCLATLPSAAAPATTASGLPPAPAFVFGAPISDWLIAPPPARAGVYRGADDHEVVLDNGLVRRVFRLEPALATVALDSHVTGASLLRAVGPEALVTLDGREHRVGGLLGQPERAYLRRAFLAEMTADPEAFACREFEVGEPRASLKWTRVRHGEDRPWPPPGVALTFRCTSPDPALAGVGVSVHYELYDGLPVYAKWLTVTNGTDREIVVDRFVGRTRVTSARRPPTRVTGARRTPSGPSGASARTCTPGPGPAGST